MASSLFSGVSGLRAHQQMLDVVGNNLANLNTTAFKAQRVLFADLLSATLRPATAPVASQFGGTNPVQIGLGVKTAAIDTDVSQGSLEATGNVLDLAIEGPGYFVVNDGLRNVYTRDGAFAVDANNTLVDPATGYRVQRFDAIGEGSATDPAFQVPGDQSIRIPYGMTIPGRATSLIRFQGNLDAAAVGPLAETMTSRQPFLVGGAAATGATLLNALDSNGAAYAAGDQILITGTDASGTAVSTSVAVSAASTMGDLLTAVNGAFSGVTATLDAAGNLVFQANATGPAALNLVLADAAGNTGSTTFTNHNMVLSVDGKDGDTLITAIDVYDTQGTPHTLNLTFQKQGSNLWDLTVSMDPTKGTMTDALVQGIQFNDDGSFQQISGSGVGDGDITFQVNGLSAPQTLSMSLGSTNGFDGLTQFGGDSSAAAVDQDGYAPGVLTDLLIGADGLIEGLFSNGRKYPIAQLLIASFSNPAGLQREGNNYLSVTSNSGLPLLGTAVSGGRGPVRSGVLEASNVDVALEFTRLIIAQRGFQVNARTITASNEVLQELANIIR